MRRVCTTLPYGVSTSDSNSIARCSERRTLAVEPAAPVMLSTKSPARCSAERLAANVDLGPWCWVNCCRSSSSCSVLGRDNVTRSEDVELPPWRTMSVQVAPASFLRGGIGHAPKTVTQYGIVSNNEKVTLSHMLITVAVESGCYVDFIFSLRFEHVVRSVHS